MLRCARPLSFNAVAMALGMFALPAAAQMPRHFPATALRGDIAVTQPPDVLLNGRPARLAPGARIRGENNLLMVSGALAGSERITVHYTLDPGGLLLDVWVLTAEERARRPWPRSPDEAAAWQFDAGAQSWSRP